MDFNSNDWKHIIRNENAQKCFKTVCYEKQGTRKVKGFQKLSHKEIYFALPSNNTKYINPFYLMTKRDERIPTC